MDEIFDINTLFGPFPMAHSDLAIDSLLLQMQQNQIRGACTYSTLGLLLDATVGNAATRAACGDHGELLPVASLNPTTYFGNKASLANLKGEGFRMARLFPTAHRYSADYAPFTALVKDLAATPLPLVVQIEARGELSTFAQALAGYPSAVVFANVDTAHLAELIAVLKSRPNLYVETSQLNGVGAIRAVAESVGVDRLLLGTGAPYQPVTSAIKVLEFSGLPQEARRQILGENARRILA